MLQNKDIIVVFIDEYRDLARRLAHAISKIDGCNGAAWSIKQYKDNEFQLGGIRYVLIVGNEDENELTKTYLSEVKNLKNNNGACYGYDGSKAIIFGEGKLEQREKAEEVYKSSKKAVDTIKLVALFLVWEVVAIPVLIYMYLFLKKEKKALLELQTKTAANFFLGEYLHSWLGIEPKA